MRCSRLETRLNDLLDRRADPRSDAELVAHAAECPRCRRLTDAYVALVRGADDLRTVSSAVVRSPFGLRGAAGAVLALAVVLLIYLTGSFVPPPPLVAPEPTPVAARPVPVVAEFAFSTGRAYLAFVQGTARGVDEAFVLASSLPPPRELLDPVVFPDDGLLKRIGNEWVPAAGETLDALGRVFTAEATL